MGGGGSSFFHQRTLPSLTYTAITDNCMHCLILHTTINIINVHSIGRCIELPSNIVYWYSPATSMLQYFSLKPYNLKNYLSRIEKYRNPLIAREYFFYYLNHKFIFEVVNFRPKGICG